MNKGKKSKQTRSGANGLDQHHPETQILSNHIYF